MKHYRHHSSQALPGRSSRIRLFHPNALGKQLGQWLGQPLTASEFEPEDGLAQRGGVPSYGTRSIELRQALPTLPANSLSSSRLGQRLPAAYAGRRLNQLKLLAAARADDLASRPLTKQTERMALAAVLMA